MRACGEEEETLLHFLGKCSATRPMMMRYHTIGAYILQIEELRKAPFTRYNLV